MSIIITRNIINQGQKILLVTSAFIFSEDGDSNDLRLTTDLLGAGKKLRKWT